MSPDLFESGLWCRILVQWPGDRDMFVDCGRPAVSFVVVGDFVISRCHIHLEPGWDGLSLDEYLVCQVMES